MNQPYIQYACSSGGVNPINTDFNRSLATEASIINTCSREYWTQCSMDLFIRLLPMVYFIFLCSIGAYYILLDRKRNAGSHDPNNLHNEMSQALGIASLYSKRTFVGKKFRNPSHFFRLIATFIEFPAFMFAPFRYGYYDYIHDDIRNLLEFSYHGHFEIISLSVFYFLISIIFFISKLSSKSTSDLILHDYNIYALTYDLGSILFFRSAIRLGHCSVGPDTITFSDGSNCSCYDRFQAFAIIGFFTYLLALLLTLKFKIQNAHHEAMSSSFHFQASFSIIMVVARALCPIFEILFTQFRSLGYLAIPAVAYSFVMGYLFLYNYHHQPCLGSGKHINNSRAVTFASACYISLSSMVLSLLNEEKAHKYAWILFSLTPLVSSFAWYRNNYRASMYHIPSERISILLASPSEHIRKVAIIAFMMTKPSDFKYEEYKAMRKHLFDIVTSKSDIVSIRMLACRAIWHVNRPYFDALNICFEENTEEEYIDNNIFMSIPDEEVSWIIGGNATSVFNRVAKQKLQIEAMGGSLSKQSMSEMNNKKEKEDDETFVDDELDLEIRKTWNMEVLEQVVFQVYYGNDMGRIEAARLLGELYKSNFIKISKATFLQIITVLCASDDFRELLDSAQTLYSLYGKQFYRIKYIQYEENLAIENKKKTNNDRDKRISFAAVNAPTSSSSSTALTNSPTSESTRKILNDEKNTKSNQNTFSSTKAQDIKKNDVRNLEITSSLLSSSNKDKKMNQTQQKTCDDSMISHHDEQILFDPLSRHSISIPTKQSNRKDKSIQELIARYSNASVDDSHFNHLDLSCPKILNHISLLLRSKNLLVVSMGAEVLHEFLLHYRIESLYHLQDKTRLLSEFFINNIENAMIKWKDEPIIQDVLDNIYISCALIIDYFQNYLAIKYSKNPLLHSHNRIPSLHSIQNSTTFKSFRRSLRRFSVWMAQSTTRNDSKRSLFHEINSYHDGEMKSLWILKLMKQMYGREYIRHQMYELLELACYNNRNHQGLLLVELSIEAQLILFNTILPIWSFYRTMKTFIQLTFTRGEVLYIQSLIKEIIPSSNFLKMEMEIEKLNIYERKQVWKKIQRSSSISPTNQLPPQQRTTHISSRSVNNNISIHDTQILPDCLKFHIHSQVKNTSTKNNRRQSSMN